MKKLRFGLILALFSSWPAWAGETCTAVDLRDQNVAPVRNQLYYSNGSVKESDWCFAFALANAAGQALGQAVSPQYIALTVNATIAPNGPKSINLFRHGGQSGDAHEAVENAGGYCTDKSFSQLASGADWYDTLQARATGLSFGEFLSRVNGVCDKDRLTTKFRFNYAETLDYFDSREAPGVKQARDKQQRAAMISKVDAILNIGRFAVIAVKGDPGSPKHLDHVLTVVGRTSDCQLIIQDSIPESGYDELNLPKFFNKVELQHFQYWNHQPLEDHITAVGYAGDNLPASQSEGSVQ